MASTEEASAAISTQPRWLKAFRESRLLHPARTGPDIPSLYPSSMIDTSLAWSKGPRGHEQLRIHFSHDWDSQKGDVFDWYRSQPSTKFKSVQYRKERQEPFCHEFLVLRLENGDICRLERMGDPLQRTAALARTGTTSHDLAQVFSPPQEIELDTTSDVVAEIHYPDDSDLLDVLAVCYGIRCDPEARQYTLQRYNCYFFVWAILSCLARGVAAWNQLFTPSAWNDATEAAVEKLNRISHSHSSKAKPTELAFRVSRLLAGRDEKNTFKFLLDVLHTELNEDETRRKVCEALASPLWTESARTAIRGALHAAANSAADSTRRNDRVGRQVLETVCPEAVLKVARNVMDMQELRLVERQWDLEMHHDWRSRARATIKEYQDEHRIGALGRFSRSLDMAGCTITGSITGMAGSLSACISEGPDTLKRFRSEWDRLHPVDTMPKARQLAGTVCVSWLMLRFVLRVVSQYARTTAIGAQVKYMNTYANTEFPCAPDWIDMTDIALSGAFDVLSHQDNPKFMIACILRVLDGTLDFTRPRSMDDEDTRSMGKLWDKTWSNWVWQSVGDTLVDVVVDRLTDADPKCIKVIVPSQGASSCEQLISYTQLYDMIISPRVKAHSERVGKHQLGSATRIVSDVRNAMSRIWAAIPKATKSTAPPAGVTQI